jgi:hypothetical protein
MSCASKGGFSATAFRSISQFKRGPVACIRCPVNPSSQRGPPGAQDFNSARLKLVLSGLGSPFNDRKPTAIAIRVDYELLQDVPEPQSQVVHLNLRPGMRMKNRVSLLAGEQRLVPAE